MKTAIVTGIVTFMILIGFAFSRERHLVKPHTTAIHVVVTTVPKQVKTEPAVPACGWHYVVCHGIHSIPEYNHVVLTDPVVQKLYRVVGPVKLTTLDRATFAYDSYRISDKIYWTRRPRFIPAGEPIISDGVYAVLQRCGNLISMTPKYPVLNTPDPLELYPPVRVYDDPTPPEIAVTTPFIPGDNPVPASPRSEVQDKNIPIITDAYVVPSGDTNGTLFMTTPLPCCTLSVPATPPVSTPEPSTGSLSLIGLFSVIISLSALKRKRGGNGDDEGGMV